MLKNSQIPTENVTESAAFPRTDLACESVGALNEPYRGAVSEEGEICSVPVSRLEVLNKEGEIETGRKRGSYVTLYCPLMKYLDANDAENITEALSVLLREFTQKLCGAPVSSATKVLVAGLGNRFITADALGPRAADKVAVTSHVMESGLLDSIGCSSISAVHPKAACLHHTAVGHGHRARQRDRKPPQRRQQREHRLPRDSHRRSHRCGLRHACLGRP